MISQTHWIPWFAVACCAGLSLADQPGQLACKSNRLDKIDRRLRETVETDDLWANIGQLRIYARELNNLLNILRQGRLAEIWLVVKASELAKGHRCGRKEFDLLHVMDEALDMRGSKFSVLPAKCRRRIDSVANKILKEFSDRCAPVHKDGVLKADKEADQSAQERARMFLGAIEKQQMLSEAIPEGSMSRVRSLAMMSSLVEQNKLLVIYEIMRKFALLDGFDLEKERKSLTSDVVAYLMTKYILDDCQIYVSLTGDVAKVGLLDVELNDREVFNEDQMSYYRILASYHLCKVALSERDKLASALAKYLSRR